VPPREQPPSKPAASRPVRPSDRRSSAVLLRKAPRRTLPAASRPVRPSDRRSSAVLLRKAPRPTLLSRRTVAPTEESGAATVHPVERLPSFPARLQKRKRTGTGRRENPLPENWGGVGRRREERAKGPAGERVRAETRTRRPLASRPIGSVGVQRSRGFGAGLSRPPSRAPTVGPSALQPAAWVHGPARPGLRMTSRLLCPEENALTFSRSRTHALTHSRTHALSHFRTFALQSNPGTTSARKASTTRGSKCVPRPAAISWSTRARGHARRYGRSLLSAS
jgi:hypothetical protein